MKLYGIFVVIDSVPKWCLCRNKRKAIKFARQHQGEVRALDDSGWGSPSSWDAPTFRVTADRVWPEVQS